MQKIRKIAFFLLLIFLVFLFVGCGSDVDTSSPEALLKSVFSKPENDKDSGMTSFKISNSNSEAVINYNYFPVGISSFQEELGVELTPKLKTLFEADNTFNKVTIIAYGPFEDNYGNITWKPMLSMEITREIINKINWDNFAKQNLIKVAQNVEIFRE